MPTFARDDGARLHVETLGRGPPLVLLHGWSRSSSDLAPLAARLAASFRVILPDLRGHGRSAPAALTLDLLAGDLAALLGDEALLGGPGAGAAPVVVGWSLGGQVAMAALARDAALQGRVRALGLVGATPRFTEGDGWPHGQPARGVEGLALRVRRQPARTLGRFLDDCLAPGEAEALGPARLERLRAAPAPDAEAALAGLDLLASADLRPLLPALALPVLVIHGEADAVVPPAAGRALAAALPSARLVLLPGAGHAPFLAREAEVADLVAALAGAGAAAGAGHGVAGP